MISAASHLHPRDLGIGQLFWHVRDAVVVAEASSSRIALWNPAAEQLLGYPAAEVLGQPIDVIIPEAVRARHRAGLAHFRATRHGRIIDTHAAVEVPALHRSGAEVWVELTLSRLDVPDRQTYVLALLRDATARRRAEAELQASAERLRLALAGASMGTWDWNARANRLVVSPATEALHGYVPGAGPDTAERFEEAVHPDDRHRVRQSRVAALWTGHLALEYRVVWPDGSVHWLSLAGRVLCDPAGQAERLAGVVADITHRKRAEEKRAELLREQARRAEAEAGRRRIAEILESIDEAFFALDREGRFTYVNRRTAEFLGRDQTELLGQPMCQVVPEALLPFFAPDQQLVGEGKSRVVEAYCAPLDVWLEVRAYPGREGLSVYFRDISERKRAEAATRRLAAIVECSEDAIIGKTLEGIITSWNSAAERLYGYGAGEVLGRSIALLVPPDRSDELLTILTRLRRGERVQHFETVRVRKDGSRVAVALSISPVQDAAGRVVGAATIARDITKRQRAQERQRVLAEATRAFAEVVTDSSALLERVARLLAEATGAACAIRLVAADGTWLAPSAAYHPNPELQQVGGIRPHRPRGIRDVPLVARGRVIGSLLLVSDEGSGPPDPADEALVGDLAARAALAIDSAQLYEAERAARAAAEAAVQMRDQFLSVAAHELKTPITALRLQAQLMLRDLDRRAAYDAEAVHRALQQIDAQSHKLDRLGKQLLDITRLDGGQLRLEPRTSDLSQIVAEAVASVRATLTPARVRLQLPSAPVLITADALRLEQVVGNLLDNAVKFSPGVGQIEVEVSEAEEGFVRLAVRDHGISIPPDKREHMFERFYQAHRSEHRSGLGLGLYISRRIVELHGGRIMAEFPPEGGTRFVVLLPAARAAP